MYGIRGRGGPKKKPVDVIRGGGKKECGVYGEYTVMDRGRRRAKIRVAHPIFQDKREDLYRNISNDIDRRKFRFSVSHIFIVVQRRIPYNKTENFSKNIFTDPVPNEFLRFTTSKTLYELRWF